MFNTRQNQNQDEPNLFDDFEQVPSISFADAPVGTVIQGVISRLPREVQSTDFATKEPKYWKNGEPQLSVVMHVDITHQNGIVETRGLWAKKPSSMFRALGQAQKDAGERFKLGGTLMIRLEKLEPTSTPGMSPQKIYAAKYIPPAPETSDPWKNQAQPQPQPQLQPQPQPQAAPKPGPVTSKPKW